jgi:anti-anti-sigma factor
MIRSIGEGSLPNWISCIDLQYRRAHARGVNRGIRPELATGLRVGSHGGTVVVVTHEHLADELRIGLAGEVDGSNADRLYAVLSGHLDAHPVRACIDMTELTFIDCAGLAVLQRLGRTLGDRVRLEGAVHPRVRRLLKLARPDEGQADSTDLPGRIRQQDRVAMSSLRPLT